jgi:hypothetical protein
LTRRDVSDLPQSAHRADDPHDLLPTDAGPRSTSYHELVLLDLAASSLALAAAAVKRRDGEAATSFVSQAMQYMDQVDALSADRRRPPP